MLELKANEYNVIIDADAGQIEGYTTIHYESDGGTCYLWRRYVGTRNQPGIPQPWERVDLGRKFIENNPDVDVTPAQIETAERTGSFRSDPVISGQLLEYGIMASGDHDPNAPTRIQPGMQRQITIIGLLERTHANWLGDHIRDVGGTFYHQHFDTVGYGETRVRLQISEQPPGADAYGVPVFEKVLAEQASGYSTVHLFEVTPLLPGQHYYATILLHDVYGRWTMLPVDEFTTLLRRVELQFPVMFIENDGDPNGESGVELRVTVREGRSVVQGFQLGNDDDQLTVKDKDWVLTKFPPIIIGPKAITPEFAKINFTVEGTDYDGIGEENEQAAGYHTIPIPYGRGKETVKLANQWWTAYPLDGEDFEFRVFAFYSVSYHKAP
jgi:hypothetical protein